MKKFRKYFLVLVTLLLSINKVKAFGATTGVITQAGYTSDSSSGYGLAVKVADNTAYLCTEYSKETPAGHGITCSLNDDWDLRTRMGVAAIINSSNGAYSTTSVTAPYFAAELAINQFLYEKNGGHSYNQISGAMNLSSTYKSLYNTYLAAANEAYNTDVNVTFSIDTSTLSFTRSGDNYVSNTINVTTNVGYDAATSLGSIQKNGNSFNVVIPASALTTGEKSNVNVTVTSGVKTYSVARNYTCGSYQTITPGYTEAVNTAAVTANASGSISRTKLTINKVDNKNIPLSGATIKITGPNNYSKTIKMDTNSIVLEDLEYGKYTIEETKAPNGFVVDKDSKQTVTLSESDLSKKVTIKNNYTKVIISKVDASGKKELPGATLEVLNEKKEKMSCTILDKDGKEKKLDECSWVSSDKPVTLVGLSNGKYYLKETIAPEGYTLNQELVLFEVDGTKESVNVEMKNELVVDVPNTLNSRSAMLISIAMFDIALGIGILLYVKRNKIEE